MATSQQLGRTVRRLRRAQRRSQYALADAASISRQYLREVEAGASNPTLAVLRRLAKALGVSMTALLE
jgi:transcriptional regulator with XRE-family HTH domain